jgi:RNA polymerase sigma-70 factor (ECF subfamily)
LGVVKVTDEKLIKETLDGNREAYRELVIRYQQLIFAVVLKIVDNYQDAEDIAQETFVKAYQSLASYRGEAKFSTWLVRLATNKALDYLRKQQRLARDVLEENVERLSVTSESLPERIVLHKEDLEYLRQGLDNLPDSYRRALYRCYFDELSCKEIAEHEGVPVKTIASRLYRGKKILREQPKGGM